MLARFAHGTDQQALDAPVRETLERFDFDRGLLLAVAESDRIVMFPCGNGHLMRDRREERVGDVGNDQAYGRGLLQTQTSGQPIRGETQFEPPSRERPAAWRR